MFRKKKGPGGVQGYDRISRLIEDRQRELADDSTAESVQDEDTIVLGAASGAAGAAVPATEAEDEGVSLFDVRGRAAATQPERSFAYEAVEPSPSGDEPAARTMAVPDNQAAALTEGAADPSTDAYAPPRRDEPARPAPAAMSVPDLATMGGSSLVAVDATWEGKLHSQGDVRVEGTLRGEVQTSARLIVAPHASIHGTVRARSIMLGGDVEGEITCDERLEILPGGSARGQINSGTLVVHEGAYIDSRFQMRRDPAAADG